MLASAAAQRLLSGRVPAFLWILLSIVAFAPALLFALGKAAPSQFWADAASLFLGLATLIFMLFTFWKLERALADYQDRRGDPSAWFGWTLGAYLPLLAVVAIAIWRLDIDEDIILQETILIALLSLTAPILVHASGRAIDQHGPEMNAIWQSWFPRYWMLVGAYLLATLPLYLASDIIWYLLGSNDRFALLGELIAGFLSTAGAALAMALTVEAFHRAEQV